MSSQGEALALLDAAAGEDPLLPWKLDWQQTIGRLRSLVMRPELLDQRALNVCGPAVFFRIWFARDPVGAATFGYRLLKSGTADIGSTTVTPGQGLMSQDYAVLRATTDGAAPGSMPESADWMLVSALRDSENFIVDYLGQPNTPADRLRGVTLPSTVAGWLQSTNMYSSVANSTTVFGDTWESLQALMWPGTMTDVALMMNSGFSHLFPAPSGGPEPADFLSTPNHYVQLLGPVAVGASPGWMKLSVWSWGRNEIDKWTSEAKFLSNYFGPIIAIV